MACDEADAVLLWRGWCRTILRWVLGLILSLDLWLPGHWQCACSWLLCLSWLGSPLRVWGLK